MERIRKNIFGCTQKEFSRIAGVTQPSVCRWEYGVYPTMREMQRIRDYARKNRIPWNDAWFFEDTAA